MKRDQKKSNSDIKEICTELCDRFRLEKERVSSARAMSIYLISHYLFIFRYHRIN